MAVPRHLTSRNLKEGGSSWKGTLLAASLLLGLSTVAASDDGPTGATNPPAPPVRVAANSPEVPARPRVSALAGEAFSKGLELCQEGSPAGPLWLAQAVDLDPANANYRTALHSYQASFPRLRGVLSKSKAFSNGKVLVSEQGIFTLDGATVATLPEAPTQVAFSASGNRLVTIDEQGQAQVWSLPEGKPVGPVYSDSKAAALDSEGERLALADTAGNARVWKVADGSALTAALSPPAELNTDDYECAMESLTFAHSSPLLLGAGMKGVCLWDDKGELLFSHKLESIGAQVAFSPDDSRFLVREASQSVSYPGTVHLFETTPGTVQRLVHAQPAVDACWDPTGRTVATLSRDGMARLWNAEDGMPTLEMRLGPAEDGIDMEPGSVSYSADGQSILFTSQNVSRILSIEEDTEWATPGFSGGDGSLFTDRDEVLTLGRQARLWDTSGLAPLLRRKSYGAEGGWTPRGAFWFVEDKAFHVVDPKSGKALGPAIPRDGVYGSAHLAVSPNQATMAFSSGSRVELWDIPNGNRLVEPFDAGEVRWMDFTPDGSHLLTGGDGPVPVVRDPRSGKVTLKLDTVEDFVHSVTFSRDSKMLAGASLSGQIYVWDLSTGKRVGKTLLQDEYEDVRDMAFTPDSTQLLTTGNDCQGILWDLATGERVTTVGHHWVVSAADICPTGDRFATVGGDGSCRIWAMNGTPLTLPWKLSGNGEKETFSPTGEQLAIAESGGTVRIWDGRSGLPLTPPLPGQVDDGGAYCSPWRPWHPSEPLLVTVSEYACSVWTTEGDEDEPTEQSLLGASVWTGQQLLKDGQLMDVDDWDDLRERYEAQAADHATLCAHHASNLYLEARRRESR